MYGFYYEDSFFKMEVQMEQVEVQMEQVEVQMEQAESLGILSVFNMLEDKRQPWKVKHRMTKIIAIAIFATMGGYDD
jgi:methionyl-tRNA synthetase